jgi:hypothetical protein
VAEAPAGAAAAAVVREAEPVETRPEAEPVAPEPEPVETEPEAEPVAPEPEPEPVAPIPIHRPEPEPAPDLPPAAEVARPAEPAAAAAEPAAAVVAAEPAPPRRRRRPRRLLPLLGAVVLAAIAVAVAFALTSDDDPTSSTKKATAARPDPECLRLWNTTDTAQAADLRVTVGQFDGAYGRISRVDPLPGTLMQPSSCALTLYQPDTDTHLILVAGVKDQIGYVDATTYPRAATLGWPKSAKQSNVRVRPDGTLRAIQR